jgi:hypothetical protein
VLRPPHTAQGQLYGVVTPREASFDAKVVDNVGNLYVQLSGYRTVALPSAVDTTAFRVLKPVPAFQAAAD